MAGAMAVALVIVCTGFPVYAVGSTNLTLTLDKTQAEVGDTVTVTIGNRDMRVVSFVGGITFDPTMVVCTGVNGKAMLTETDGDTVTAVATSTVETAATYNAVGFAFAGTSPKSYREAAILTVTFEIIRPGSVAFTLYEDSDGANGFFSDAAETSIVRVAGVDSSEALSGRNLALNGTIIVDSVSTNYTEKEAYNANDGDHSTRWQSDSPGHDGEDAWIGVEWATSVIVEYLVIDWEKAHPTVDGYRVQISDNGSYWTDTPFQVTRSGEVGEDHQTDTVYLPAFPDTQYVRVLCETAEIVDVEGTGETVKSYPSVYELEVYGISENLALTGTAIVDSVSSQYGNGGHVAAHINDGDSSTRWQSASAGTTESPAWAGIRWSEAQTIDKLVINWTSAHPATDGLSIQISDNGTDWTDAPFSATRNEQSNRYVTDTIQLIGKPTTSYVRVYSFKNDSQDGKAYSPAILELEVYGDRKVMLASDAPLTPSVSVTGDTHITLTKVTGYEYSMDGKTWQSSPTFEGLTPETVYPFCQRVAASGEAAAGATSTTIRVMTTPKEEVALLRGDVNLDGEVGAADLTAMARHVGGIEEILDETAGTNAEITDDGNISSADLTKLARFVGGIIDRL